MLSNTSQLQKDKYYVILLTWCTENSQIYGDKNVVARGWEVGAGELVFNMGAEFQFRVIKCSVDGVHGGGDVCTTL